MLELGQFDGMEANDTHIVNIVDWLLQYAFSQRASDIHIEPRREKGAVRSRIDGVPPYLIKATVLGVMAQRLVRTLCEHCAMPGAVDAEDLSALAGREVPSSELDGCRAPKGCEQCRDTGFRGRAGIYELLTLSPAIKALITEQTDIDLVRQTARDEGMQRLAESGAQKIIAGETTIAEVLRAVPSSNSND